MGKILLARIDSRLSHGKVVEYWTNHIGADSVIIANDRLSEDEFEKKLMDLTIDDKIKSYYLKIDQVKDFLKEEDEKNYFLLVENSKDLEKIIDSEILIKKINLGIMHLSRNKKLLSKLVAVSDEDMEIFKKFLKKDIEIFLQLSPFEEKEDLKSFI